MNAPLDIGRLSTRIRSGEPERAQALAGQVRRLADRQLMPPGGQAPKFGPRRGGHGVDHVSRGRRTAR